MHDPLVGEEDIHAQRDRGLAILDARFRIKVKDVGGVEKEDGHHRAYS